MGKICSTAVEELDYFEKTLLPDILRNSDPGGGMLVADSCAWFGRSKRVQRGLRFQTTGFE